MTTAVSRDLWRYREPRRHEIISALIRAHSTNPEDIREAVLRGHDLGLTREMLELGCGFGFMSGAIAPRLHRSARITGVDACRDNRDPFTERVRSAGRRAAFIWMTIGGALPWRDRVYDLCVASHSLYYFPQAISEIARTLSPDGRFFALTHGIESARALSRTAGLPPERSPVVRVVNRFCSENGEALLKRSFALVEPVRYVNSLVFAPDEAEDLLLYLRFKFRALTEWPESEPELRRLESTTWRESAFADGPVTIDKTDTGFWCAGPEWGPGRPDYEARQERHRIPDESWPL